MRTHFSESHLICVHRFTLAFPGGVDDLISFVRNIHPGGKLQCLSGPLTEGIYDRWKAVWLSLLCGVGQTSACIKRTVIGHHATTLLSHY